MTGPGHRVLNFMLIGALTRSLPAALFGLLGSAFPDTVEYLIWGAGRNRHHRRSSHWIVLWLAGFLFCFLAGAKRTVPSLSGLAATSPESVWGCAAFWFLGCVLHVLGDACCGKVPLFVPWRRRFGFRVFEMSPRRGEMSRGELVFVAFTSLSALGTWLSRGVLL